MTKLTPGRRSQLLDRLESGETVLAIANDFGMSRQALYAHRKKDHDFANAWRDAAILGAKVRLCDLEKEANRRAIEGWLDPIYYRGERVGSIRRFSDRLLMFRIKAEAKRAGDNSYVDRVDAKSEGERGQTGVIVIGRRAANADEWYDEHSKA